MFATPNKHKAPTIEHVMLTINIVVSVSKIEYFAYNLPMVFKNKILPKTPSIASPEIPKE